MVHRSELIKHFEAAHRKGWRVSRDNFPEAVDEFFPARDKLFRALERFSPGEVKYLILGQDPYPSQDANGIAFSVERNPQEGPLPQALVRIMKHIHPIGGGSPSLDDWITKKKILLLNSALTVPKANDGRPPSSGAGGHLHLWQSFITSIVVQLKQDNPNAQLVAWGVEARKLMRAALGKSGVFTTCRHPSRPHESFEQFWQTPVGQSLCMESPLSPGTRR